MILLDKTKPQTFSWPFASGSLHYCFLPAIPLSCFSLVPQHWYASKRRADYHSLRFHSSRCLSDTLWLQLSRVKRPKLKKKIPRVLWSPLLSEAVQLKQDVWSQSVPAVLIAVWFSKLALKLCWHMLGQRQEKTLSPLMKSQMAEKHESAFHGEK